MLIFDRFPTRELAERFAAQAEAIFKRTAKVHDRSDHLDFFSFVEITPPVVAVMVTERDAYRVVKRIKDSAKEFRGVFAGS